MFFAHRFEFQVARLFVFSPLSLRRPLVNVRLFTTLTGGEDGPPLPAPGPPLDRLAEAKERDFIFLL